MMVHGKDADFANPELIYKKKIVAPFKKNNINRKNVKAKHSVFNLGKEMS